MIQIKLIESDTMTTVMEQANQFLTDLDERDVVDVKYQSSMSFTAEEQLDSYSVMIVYCVHPIGRNRTK